MGGREGGEGGEDGGGWGRMGKMGRLEEPGGGVLDEFDETAKNLIVGLQEVMSGLRVQVVALNGEFNPGLGFGGFGFTITEFGDKSCSVTTLGL